MHDSQRELCCDIHPCRVHITFLGVPTFARLLGLGLSHPYQAPVLSAALTSKPLQTKPLKGLGDES